MSEFTRSSIQINFWHFLCVPYYNYGIDIMRCLNFYFCGNSKKAQYNTAQFNFEQLFVSICTICNEKQILWNFLCNIANS